MKLDKNLVSIIVPYFKKKKYFEKTLRSICDQSYKNNELIIIYDDDDKSELNYVKKLIRKYKKKNSRVIVNQRNIGAGRWKISSIYCAPHWQENSKLFEYTYSN